MNANLLGQVRAFFQGHRAEQSAWEAFGFEFSLHGIVVVPLLGIELLPGRERIFGKDGIGQGIDHDDLDFVLAFFELADDAVGMPGTCC